MSKKSIFKEAQEVVSEKSKDLNCSCLIQSGSSLRKEDFTSKSDIDLLAIFEEEKKERWGHDHSQNIKISILKESKKEFLEGLHTGHPFELMALKFGKIRKDDGFLKELKPSNYRPTKKTHEIWIRSGLNHYSKMINGSYFNNDFYQAAYHSFRSFSRSILLKEEKVLLESDKSIMDSLLGLDEKAADYFWSLRKDRSKDHFIEAKNTNILSGCDHAETFDKVDYIGEKAMSDRNKIFPSHNSLIEIMEEHDLSDCRMFQRDERRVDFSFRGDDGLKIFKFDMKTGKLDRYSS